MWGKDDKSDNSDNNATSPNEVSNSDVDYSVWDYTPEHMDLALKIIPAIPASHVVATQVLLSKTY